MRIRTVRPKRSDGPSSNCLVVFATIGTSHGGPGAAQDCPAGKAGRPA
jgi:hypothetical protein